MSGCSCRAQHARQFPARSKRTSGNSRAAAHAELKRAHAFGLVEERPFTGSGLGLGLPGPCRVCRTLTRQKKQAHRCSAPKSTMTSLSMRIREGGTSSFSDMVLRGGRARRPRVSPAPLPRRPPQPLLRRPAPEELEHLEEPTQLRRGERRRQATGFATPRNRP